MSRVAVVNDKVVSPNTNSLITKTEELEGLVKEFYEHDSKIKSLNKITNPLKDRIKEIMQELDTDKYTFDDYKVSCSKIIKANFNADILLSIVKKLGLTQLIKTKEYVDENELERMIYNNEVDAQDFLPAQTITESIRLQVTNKPQK